MSKLKCLETINNLTIECSNEGDGTALSKILLENEQLFEECLEKLNIHCYGCDFLSDTVIEVIHDEII